MIIFNRLPQSATLLALLAIAPAFAAAESKSTSATPAEQLKVLPGFQVQLLHSATADEGSWICMTADPTGRLIVSPQNDQQPLLRITLTRQGEGRQDRTDPRARASGDGPVLRAR